MTAERRESAIRRLQAQGVFPQDPPPLLPETDIVLPEPEAVLRRALSLAVLALFGEGLTVEEAWADLKHWQVDGALTAEEKSFLQNRHPDPARKPMLIAQKQACFTLLWALGLIEDLGELDPEQGEDILGWVLSIDSPKDLLEPVSYRSLPELLGEEDYLQLYEAFYKAQVTPQSPLSRLPPQGPLMPNSVKARLKALRWLLGRSRS